MWVYRSCRKLITNTLVRTHVRAHTLTHTRTSVLGQRRTHTRSRPRRRTQSHDFTRERCGRTNLRVIMSCAGPTVGRRYTHTRARCYTRTTGRPVASSFGSGARSRLRFAVTSAHPTPRPGASSGLLYGGVGQQFSKFFKKLVWK